MQTSSNFFNKNLLGLEDEIPKRKKIDIHNQAHIVSDPLRAKEDLTPWGQINPKYNFNTERLIKFKQKINQQPKIQIIEEEVKQVKPEMISNLFNFYKNNKQKKKSTLNNAKRKNKNSNSYRYDNDQDNGWYLPPIHDRTQFQDELCQNDGNEQTQNSKQDEKQKNDKKKKTNFIESISIRQYLSKLKQKQKVIALSSTLDRNSRKQTSRTIDSDQFTSNRYAKKGSKQRLNNSLSLSKQLGHNQQSYKYAPIRNPENNINRKGKSNFSHIQSLEQSFENYKKAAEMEVHQIISEKKQYDRNISKLGINFSLAQKNLFKSNIPLSSLFGSSDNQRKKSQKSVQDKNSPLKKYNTISYQRSFTPVGECTILPKVGKNASYRS